VLAHKLTKPAEKLFYDAIQGAHQVEDVTPPIAHKAREYRDYYHDHPVTDPHTGKVRNHLTTPDAIHLATASILKCETFWTFDGCSVKKQDNTIGLLWLENRVGEDDLIISQPNGPQDEMHLVTG
jgi:predicted nucleic acid-binding protein